MKILHSTRGQSTAEYAVLFAIVIGAAIAMQAYVKSRLQGAMAGTSDTYANAAQGLGGYFTYEPNRTTASQSASNMTMASAKAGTVTIDSNSQSTQTK